MKATRAKCHLYLSILATLLICSFQVTAASLRLSSCFQSNMVLQRNAPIPLTGESQPNTKISLTFDGATYDTTSDNNGNWQIILPPHKAGGPYALEIKSDKQTAKLDNVLFGDVWLCGGQSNMEWPVSRSLNGKEEVQNATNSSIRFICISHRWHMREQNTFPEKWQVCSPKTIGNVSGAAYFFARDLQQHLKIPIGIIQSAWGGSPIAPWIPASYLLDHPTFGSTVKDFQTWPDNRKPEEEAKEKRLYDEYKIWAKEAQAAKAKGQTPPPAPIYPAVLSCRNKPSAMYNAMIAGFTKFPVCGILWYQGEANTFQAKDYPDLFKRLINGWRKAWKNDELPFLYVQLANFKERQKMPVIVDDWAELRDAQATALTLPKTGMATAIDIGQANNIHPQNKQEVGRRLALLARNIVYGEDIVSAGPMLDKLETRNNSLILHFKNASSGLVKKGDTLEGFAIAGKNNQFKWANAKIENDTVILTSPEVKNPIQVRYAWAANPIGNLYNKEGLPAFPINAKVKE